MEEGLKKRLIGAAVLASLAVIFVPMLFEEPPSEPPALPPLPSKPPANDFASDMLRDEIPAVTPLQPAPEPQVPDDVVDADNGNLALPDPEPAEPTPTVTAQTPPEPVAKPVAPPAPKIRAGLTAWVVQVGSFSSQENAERLVSKLREAGMPTPDPEFVDIRGKRYYRVRVGPVIEKSEAEGMLDKVKALSGTNPKVQQYP